MGRQAVRQALIEQFAEASGEILVATPFVCGARGMLEWTAKDRLPDGRPRLRRGYDWFEFHDDQIRRFEPGRFPWREGYALWEGIANNTFAHYDEHAGMIAAWLDTAS